MINFHTDAKTLGKAFNISDLDIDKVEEFLDYYARCKNAAKAVERIWIDETINDNARALGIFTIGRMYESKRNKREGEVS